MRKCWLEVALNGSRGRSWQPNMPVTVEAIVEEGVACAASGAAILHYHAYDPATGLQKERDLDFHRRVLTGLRRRCEALVYPTTAMRLLGQPAYAADERFAIGTALVAEGFLEMFVLPAAVRLRTPSPQPRDHRTEGENPALHGFVGDLDPALGEQVLHVPIAQAEAHIHPDGAMDDAFEVSTKST